MNFNYGVWFIVILFGLLFIEGVGGAFFGFLCKYWVPDCQIPSFSMVYESIGPKEISNFSSNNLWTGLFAGSWTCIIDILFHKKNHL